MKQAKIKLAICNFIFYLSNKAYNASPKILQPGHYGHQIEYFNAHSIQFKIKLLNLSTSS
jgi:hypothetical protein